MVILFQNKKLEKCFNNEKALIKQYGPRQAEKIKKRMVQLDAVKTLADLRKLPQIRAHELTGNLKGKVSIDLVHPYRLLIEPAMKNCPLMEDGGLDWARVTQITILEVRDTHDKKR